MGRSTDGPGLDIGLVVADLVIAEATFISTWWAGVPGSGSSVSRWA